MSARQIAAIRTAFWADKARNAEHCRKLEMASDSAMISDWMQRFNIARAMANR